MSDNAARRMVVLENKEPTSLVGKDPRNTRTIPLLENPIMWNLAYGGGNLAKLREE